ncbi:hypothetical protein RE9425_03090 [Prescottella equi]|nr:hypothetical protein RE9425_03090 [Prescottella equi]
MPAGIAVIPAGTTLWRVIASDAAYDPNSFNAKFIKPLEDARTLDPMVDDMPEQGRFDLVHDESVCPGGGALGGQLYVGLSVGAVVAEGILRDADVPPDLPVPESSLAKLSLAEMVAGKDIPVAVLDDQKGLAQMNLRLDLFGCTPMDYYDTRIIGTNILVNTPDSYGLRYRCRNGFEERSVLLADRGEDMDIRVERLEEIAKPGWARDIIENGLWESFGLTIG